MKTVINTTNAVSSAQDQKLRAAWCNRPTAVRLKSDTIALIKSCCPKSYTIDTFVFALVSRYGTIIQSEGLQELKKIVSKNENLRA